MSTRIKEAFDSVHADEQMKQQTKTALAESLAGHAGIPRRRRTVVYRVCAAMVVLILVVSLSVQQYTLRAEAAYITVEGQAGIGLSLNRKNKVITAEGLSVAGEGVLSEVEIEGLDYQEALKEILSCRAYQEIQDDQIQVSVDCHDQDVKEQLKQSADEVCSQYGHKNQGQGHSTEKKERETGGGQKDNHQNGQSQDNEGNKHQKGRRGHDSHD